MRPGAKTVVRHQAIAGLREHVHCRSHIKAVKCGSGNGRKGLGQPTRHRKCLFVKVELSIVYNLLVFCKIEVHHNEPKHCVLKPEAKIEILLAAAELTLQDKFQGCNIE